MTGVLVACVLHVVAARPGGQADVPYLIGRGPCIAVQEGRSLARGDRVLAIIGGRRPTELTVQDVRPWDGPSLDAPRPPRTDCRSWFRQDPTMADAARIEVKALARVSDPSNSSELEGAFFAVQPQQRLTVVAGTPKPVGSAERRRLIDAVRRSLPPLYSARRAMFHATRYGPIDGHEIVELYVGRPTLNEPGIAPPIKHVAIRRFFLVDGRLAAFEDYERTSGVEERAETEAPELTFRNWWISDTERTVAFTSDDEGTSWRRLSTNSGFEGVIWMVQGLREGLPVLFRRDLYTPH